MRRTVFTAVVLFLTLTFGCGGGSSDPVNSIKIKSVTPASVVSGVTTTFTITVSYDLQTADNAVIDHCYAVPFSDRGGGCPATITDGSVGIPVNGVTVRRGKGTITIIDAETFTATTILYMSLVPNQDYTSAVGVASDEYMINI